MGDCWRFSCTFFGKRERLAVRLWRWSLSLVLTLCIAEFVRKRFSTTESKDHTSHCFPIFDTLYIWKFYDLGNLFSMVLIPQWKGTDWGLLRMILWRVIRPMAEVTEELRKLHNEESFEAFTAVFPKLRYSGLWRRVVLRQDTKVT
jgi:hypothetical protein